MSRFIYGQELNFKIVNLIKDAEYSLILISPFIKLHQDLKDELRAKEKKEYLQITIVFGKNEEDPSRSFPLTELNFFKEFPNLEVKFEPRLHAKYYANDFDSILTSMNLYEYSFDKNIEFGVLSEQKLIGKNKLDSESINYFNGVIDRAESVFKQEAVFKKSFGGLKESFVETTVLVNNIQKFYKNENSQKDKKSNQQRKRGFCIRTGVKIDFNPKMPFSTEAYNSWAKFKNEEYREKYCHFSGESSNGQTSFSRPILRKNWKAASRYLSKKN